MFGAVIFLIVVRPAEVALGDVVSSTNCGKWADGVKRIAEPRIWGGEGTQIPRSCAVWVVF